MPLLLLPNGPKTVQQDGFHARNRRKCSTEPHELLQRRHERQRPRSRSSTTHQAVRVHLVEITCILGDQVFLEDLLCRSAIHDESGDTRTHLDPHQPEASGVSRGAPEADLSRDQRLFLRGLQTRALQAPDRTQPAKAGVPIRRPARWRRRAAGGDGKSHQEYQVRWTLRTLHRPLQLDRTTSRKS
jgi:hypothetical protein